MIFLSWPYHRIGDECEECSSFLDSLQVVYFLKTQNLTFGQCEGVPNMNTILSTKALAFVMAS